MSAKKWRQVCLGLSVLIYTYAFVYQNIFILAPLPLTDFAYKHCNHLNYVTWASWRLECKIDSLRNSLFRSASMKTSMLCVTGLLCGESIGFPAQRPSNAESVPMLWYHQDYQRLVPDTATTLPQSQIKIIFVATRANFVLWIWGYYIFRNRQPGMLPIATFLR